MGSITSHAIAAMDSQAGIVRQSLQTASVKMVAAAPPLKEIMSTLACVHLIVLSLCLGTEIVVPWTVNRFTHSAWVDRKALQCGIAVSQ